MTLPEDKVSNGSDEMSKLEKLHDQMRREREAWKKLLQKLEELKKKHS